MNLPSVKTMVLGGMSLLMATLPTLAQIPIEPIRLTTAQIAQVPTSTICSPVNGQWYFLGQPGPIITQSGDLLTVDMSAYRRPTAAGRVTAPANASVRFPDDATFNAILVSPSCIQWSNGTTWTK